MSIGDRVKARRTELGLSQRELAARLGYNDHTTLTRLEAGKVDPSQSRIQKLAEVLGVTPGYLMGWEDQPEDLGALAADVLKDPQLLGLVKILRYTNTIVITPTYAYDLNDDRDRELFERELMRGNEFLEYQKRILGAGRLLSVEAGNYIASQPVYGYKKINIKVGKKICPTLEPIPEEAEVVKLIFEMYRDGNGVVKISDRLEALHVPSPKGDSRWAPTTIYSMLDNVHYLGKVKWNERKAVLRVEDGQVIKSTPRAEEFLIFEGKHPAIIDQELWDAVQAIRGSHPRNHKAKNLVNPLAGLMYCNCGKSMEAKTYNSPKIRWCEPRFFCSNKIKCGGASAKMAEVLDRVVAVLEEAIEDFEVRIESGVDDSAYIHRQMVERLERRLQELRDLEVKQWAEKMKHGMPDHVFQQLNGPVVAEIEDIEHALCEAKDAVPEPVDLGERVVTFKAALEALKDPDAPVKEKNMLLKACIERIDYRRDRLPGGRRPKKGEETPIYLDFKLKI